MSHFKKREIKRVNYVGTSDGSIKSRKLTPASFYTHKMVYENGKFIGREPISTQDEGTSSSN